MPVRNEILVVGTRISFLDADGPPRISFLDADRTAADVTDRGPARRGG
jgi:hypothetical protein